MPYKASYQGVKAPSAIILPNTTLTFGGHTHYLTPPLGGFLPETQRAQMIGNKYYSSLSGGR